MFALNLCLAINLVILFIAFFFRSYNTLPNKILALLLLDTAISFFGNATVVGGLFTTFPYVFFLSWCTSGFFGPLFFTYTRLFTGSHLKFRHPIWIAAFSLSAFGLVFPINYLLLSPADRPGFVLSLMTEPLPWEMTMINIFGMLLILTSMIASAVSVRRYQQRILTTFSSLEKTKLAFIRQFVTLGIVLTMLTMVLYLTLPQHLVEYLYLPCLITSIYFFILFYTFRHHTIFTTETYEQFLAATLPASEEMQLIAPEKLELPLSELQQLAVQVTAHLKNTELYTDPDLTINLLAEQLQVSTDKLSAAINRELNKNFFDLINEQRVIKAKELLSDQISVLTIEAIGYAAGFNSRASFYRAFKKHAGLSPSAYVQTIK